MSWTSLTAIAISVALSALALPAAADALPDATPPALHLDAELLLRRDDLPAPVAMQAFAPQATSASSRQRFNGRLRLEGVATAGHFRAIKDSEALVPAGDGALKHLPAFDFDFVQSGDALIPIKRGAIPNDHPQWEYILEPGRVWQEPGDGGYARAALPFALEERNSNCIHNGVLSFLFRADGAVSRVAFEIASETCLYLQFDMWGLVAAQFTPGEVAGAAQVIAGYAAETASRIPVRPIEALQRLRPGIDLDALAGRPDVEPSSLSTHGVLIDGVHYRGNCATRLGDYPFCEVMDLPSYSLAKTVFAGTALMRLQRLYPGARDAKIADLVPECRANGNWRDVSLAQTLDMSTGNFQSGKLLGDEQSRAQVDGFFIPESHAAKIDFACNHFPRHAPPGLRVIYHTTDTYVLGTAMAAFYRQRQGQDKDLFRDLIGDLWRPLHLSPVVAITRRSRDTTGQPFTGYGLSFHTDDILKLARFLDSDNGAKLDRDMLDVALLRNPGWRGRDAGDSYRYQSGIWSMAFDLPGCDRPLWIPFMSGFGGISVALLPNRTIYYYFSDGGVFSLRPAMRALNQLHPLCGASSSTSKGKPA